MSFFLFGLGDTQRVLQGGEVGASVAIHKINVRFKTRSIKYNDVTQTLPHGSRCRHIQLHASVRKMARPKWAYFIDTDADTKDVDAHESARPPVLSKTSTDADQNCDNSDVG